MITYRTGAETDYAALSDLRYLSSQEDKTWDGKMSQQDFQAMFTEFLKKGAKDGWRYFIAEEHKGAGLIGSVFVKTLPMPPRPNGDPTTWGYTTNLYVKSEHRNQGVIMQLLERVKSWAAEQNLEPLIVWPSEEHRSLFECTGFQADTDILEFRP